MVKITEGINVFEVTRGAFDGIYSRYGYTIIDEKKAETVVKKGEKPISQKTEDELFAKEVMEKPISQWNKEEVKRFAALKELDITGTKNASEAKTIIKAFLDADSQE